MIDIDDGSDGYSDGPVPMATQERAAWAYLVAVIVTSAAYLAVMVPRAVAGPIAEVSWVRPMVVTIAASLMLTVLGTAVGYAASGLRRSGGDHEPDAGRHGDERDREIDRTGSRAAMAAIGVGYFAATVLAMADADTFWIGNTLFVLGAVSALVETGVKIRLYRRGW